MKKELKLKKDHQQEMTISGRFDVISTKVTKENKIELILESYQGYEGSDVIVIIDREGITDEKKSKRP